VFGCGKIYLHTTDWITFKDWDRRRHQGSCDV
jgi:hypothetical protein